MTLSNGYGSNGVCGGGLGSQEIGKSNQSLNQSDNVGTLKRSELNKSMNENSKFREIEVSITNDDLKGSISDMSSNSEYNIGTNNDSADGAVKEMGGEQTRSSGKELQTDGDANGVLKEQVF